MRESKPIITILATILITTLFGCSTDSTDEVIKEDNSSNYIVDLKVVSQWADEGITEWIVKENRDSRDSNDFSNIVKQFNPETKHDNILEQSLSLNIYQSGEGGNVEVHHVWKERYGTLGTVDSYKILGTRIEDKDPEISGALILTLEASNKTDKLEVAFIDKGVVGLRSQDRFIV